MRFIDLDIAGFGKLGNRVITFDEDMTVIYGLNEAGKSTIHACLRAMLFGMPRARGVASRHDAWSRYNPWKFKRYGATLRYEDGGHVYALTRDFAKDPTGLTLRDETEGCLVENGEEKLSKSLGGLSSNSYDNTISVSQLKTAANSGMAQELKNYIVNLDTTGHSDLNIEKAKSFLLNQREEILKDLDTEAARTLAANNVEIRKIEKEIAEEIKEKNKDEENTSGGETAIEEPSCEELVELSSSEELKEKLNKDRKGINTAGNIILAVMGLVLAGSFYIGYFGPKNVFSLRTGINSDRLMLYAGIAFALLLIAEIVLRIVSYMKEMKINKIEEDRILSIKIVDTDETDKKEEIKTPETPEPENEDVSRESGAAERLNKLKDHNLYLASVIKNNDEINEKAQAIDYAIEVMDELSETMKESFGYYLNEESSKYIRQLTHGAYSSISVDNDLNVWLNTSDRMVAMEQASTGTKEQIYLAVRLAVAKLIRGEDYEEDPLPIIFDDTFVNYDDDRLASAVSWIAQAYRGQKIIFSCQHREMDLMEMTGIKHTCIEI